MLKFYKTSSLFLLLLGFNESIGQNIPLGPYDTYVSTQMPAATQILSGSFNAWADEGRVVRVNLSNVTGPINISSLQYHLTGPACPTYDARGRRTPADPVPPITQLFNGSITVNPLPAAGTTADASFDAKDDGYYTVCSTGEQKPYPQTANVTIKIHSLKLLMEKHDVVVCQGASTHVNIASKYPETGGTVSYQSLHGKVTVSDNGNGCMMTFAANGDDVVVATLSAGNVTYKDTINVKAFELKFTKSVFNFLSPYNEVMQMANLLTAGSTRNNLEWKMRVNGGAWNNLNPASFNNNTRAAGDVVELSVKVRNVVGCDATATLNFYNLDLAIANFVRCDGTDLPFTVTIRPFNAAARAELLPTVANMAGQYNLRQPSFGNPRGNTNLTFAAFNASYASKVENMIWYSTMATHCNVQSAYNLWVAGKVNGKDITSWSYVIVADVNGGNCCNGSAGPVQTFTGLPVIITKQDERGKWYGWIDAVGTFRRNVRCTTTNICAPNSQYRAMIQAEENYHVGQMEMTNGSVACAGQWVVANVFAPPLMTRRWYSISGDQAQSRALAWHVFITRRNLEEARSWNMFAYPSASRCFMEREAKVQTGASHSFRMPCAYPLCP